MTRRRPMSASRRLRIFEAHDGVCCLCDVRIDEVREKWTVEHLRPLGLFGRDDDDNCAPAHEACRRRKDRTDLAAIAKAKRMEARYRGAKPPSPTPVPGSRNTPWKRTMRGKTVRREEIAT